MAMTTCHILLTSSWRSGRWLKWNSSEFFRAGLGRPGEIGLVSTGLVFSSAIMQSMLQVSVVCRLGNSGVGVFRNGEMRIKS